MKRFFNAVCFLILFYVTVPLPSVLAANEEVTVQTLFQLGSQRPVKLNMYGNQMQYVEEDNQTKIAVFYNNLAKAEATPLTSPMFDKRYGYITFIMQDGTSYSYYKSGFSIRKPSGEIIKMLYTIDDDEILKAMEKGSIQWSTFGSTAVTWYPTYDFVFKIGSNLFLKNYQANPVGIPKNLSRIYSGLDYSLKTQGIEIDKNPNVAPFIDAESGRTMVPLRCLSELLEFKVNWDEQTKEIMLEKDGFSIKINIGSKIAELRQRNDTSNNSENNFYYQYKLEMDTPPQIVHGRTFVPVRFVAEIFDSEVTWNEKTEGIYINLLNTNFANNIETFPLVNLDENQISLKTYNTNTLPYVQHFEGNLQLQAEIYNENNNRVLTLKQSEAQGTTRVFYPDEPDTFAVTDARLKTLPAGRYYADIKYGPEEKTTYRIFFDKE